MRRLTWFGGIVAAVIGVSALPCFGQASPAPAAPCPCAVKGPPLGQRFHQGLAKIPARLDFSLAYDYEWAKAATVQNRTFALKGGAADLAYNLSGKTDGIAIVARVDGKEVTNIQPGVNLSELRVLGGPRFTFGIPKAKRILPRSDLYAQGLFGYVYGFNGTFPQNPQFPTLIEPSANVFAMELGGGLRVHLWRGFGVRVVEADFVQTNLPNNANNHQDDVELSAGITYHLSRK